MTPNLQVVLDYVKATYGLRVGVTKCRLIDGLQKYSQHSWSNAGDIKTSNKDLQDKIAADLQDRFGDHIHIILTWRYNAAHWNHLHVDMWPKGLGTPPCKGGDLKIKYKNGLVTTDMPFPLTIKEEDMAILTDAEQVELQQFLAELKGVNSSVHFVRPFIPWFRKWRTYEPADFESAGSGGNVDAYARKQARAALDSLADIKRVL